MSVFTHQRCVKKKKMYGDICLCVCENKTALDDHKTICPVNIARLKFPPAESKVKFTNYAKEYEPTCVKKQQYFAIAYAYIVVSRNGETIESGSYCGSNCVNHFIQTLQRVWSKVQIL